MMSRKKPSPVLFTILLAMKPEINPSKIHPMIDMVHLFTWRETLGLTRVIRFGSDPPAHHQALRPDGRLNTLDEVEPDVI
jgi:hypothetical protein